MSNRFEFRRALILVLVTLLLFSTVFSCAFAAVALGEVSAWARPSIAKAQSYGIVPVALKGQDMTEPITRMEFAKVTVLLYEKVTGKTASVPTVDPFTDTADKEVLKAYALGIVRGTGGGFYDPEDSLTREQAAVMLTRVYLKITGGRLTAPGIQAFRDDDHISLYAKPSVYFMVYKEFIQGTGNNYFTPKGTASCEQTLTMAVRMFQAIDEAPASDNVSGYTPGMDVTGVDEAIAIIKSGEKDLSPEITITVDQQLYEGLITSPFLDGTGIDSLYYVYDANTRLLIIKLTYSLYTQIMALTTDPESAGLYATDEAKTLNGRLDQILDGLITADMDAYEKEKAVHDYMVRTYKYDTSLTDYDIDHPSLSVAGLLYYKTGVCQAYAEMFNILMTKLGIGGKLVEGDAGGDEHLWNMVRLSGDWYMVDVTWDDPIPDRGTEVSYQYFNVTDSVMALDHAWDKGSYPACTSVEYSYMNMQ